VTKVTKSQILGHICRDVQYSGSVEPAICSTPEIWVRHDEAHPGQPKLCAGGTSIQYVLSCLTTRTIQRPSQCCVNIVFGNLNTRSAELSSPITPRLRPSVHPTATPLLILIISPRANVTSRAREQYLYSTYDPGRNHFK
jgi:hypothetical protein